MILNSAQVAEKLGVSHHLVSSWAKQGKIPTVNKPVEGAKKTFWKFDSKEINAFKKNGEVPHPKGRNSRKQRISASHTPIPELFRSMNERLARIEEMILNLHKLWS